VDEKGKTRRKQEEEKVKSSSTGFGAEEASL